MLNGVKGRGGRGNGGRIGGLRDEGGGGGGSEVRMDEERGDDC